MKKTYKMIDLDCAHCAAKMENAIKKLPGVTDAAMSFLTQKLTIETEAEDQSALMKAGYPPIDIKFTDRIAYYSAFDEYHVKGKLDSMERLFAKYVNERLDQYLAMLEAE